jgi:predicted peptidase
LLTAISLAMVASCTTMKKTLPSMPSLKAETARLRISRTVETQYLLYLPQDYDTKGRQRWPLMLFLHGAGERGTNIPRVAIHGPPKLAKQGKEFPFILVAPQCPDGQVWENEALLQLLEHVTKRHAVDTNRVYLTGLSMGGYGTWKLAVAHPEKFAAIVPICGGGQTIDVMLAGRERGGALKTLPIWAFHGAKDPVVPLEESERMVNAFKRLGAKEVKLTVYPEAQHDSWTETYNNPELYEWLLKHAR